MKHTMTYRLIGYFSAVLLLFSIIVGTLFWMLFHWHTAKIHEQELKTRAVSIADTLSQFSQQGRQRRGMSGGSGGYGAYLRFIDDIAMSEVWLVDIQAKTIQICQQNSSLSYNALPSGAEAFIQQVFQGTVVSNQEFSPLLDVPSITVGAPVYGTDGNVSAALLLHSPVNGINSAQQDGVLILAFCICIALALAFFLSILLVRRFIHPLKKIQQAAEKIMEGDYSARTMVSQKDEIGSLARNIDNLFLQLANVEEEREKLDKMRQDFVSNISHELRTPVTVIKGSLEVLEEGLITDATEMQEYFRQMLSDTTHLQRLVNDLLELSRLQNTNFQIDKTQLDLSSILKEAIRSMQRIAMQKQVDIKLEEHSGALRFWGDYGRLRQMFVIVLDNAVKFSPANDTVYVKTSCSNQRFTISVADHGSGIPQEEIPYLFDRFHKERSAQNKSGSGLGLSIAKQIAERHQITIRCESSPGVCTTFSFCGRLDVFES